MATSTTNLGLIKPAGTDKIRIAQINGNMDIIDEKVGAVGNTSLQTQVTGLGVNLTGLEDCVGIVVDGAKSAVAAAAGQYIVLKNSIISGCDDGLYTAAQAIPADTTIDSTYLTAVSGGGLNALNTQLTNQLGTLSIKFGGTLSGDVLTVAKNASLGITFYYNSNLPTNAPSGGGYGGYIIFKGSTTQARIIYTDGSGILATAGFDPSSDTTIPWKKTTLT